MADEARIAKQQHGVQSVEIGFDVLRVLIDAPGPVMLSEVARQVRMPAAKVHRYMVSLIRSGLAEQVEETGYYDLGPTALALGLSAIGRLDTDRHARETAAALRSEIGHTVAIAVWNGVSAVIIAWYEPRHAVTVNGRTGSFLSPGQSATGRAFLAHLDKADAEGIIDTAYALGQIPTLGRAPLSRQEFEDLLERTRQTGFCAVEGDLLNGISALSVPVFDLAGNASMVLTALGGSAGFSVEPDGPIATALLNAAQKLSRRLGGQK